MKYRDLIYKITSSKTNETNVKKKEIEDVNDAKKSVRVKDILIGVMIGEDLVLNKGISQAVKNEVERKLTVLFNSPISDAFAFLPFDKTTLLTMLELFPDKKHHYISGREEFNEVSELKKEKLNFKALYASLNTKEDFIKQIDYLVTINIDKLDKDFESALSEKEIMVFPLSFRGTKNFSQGEKLVAPDPSGWSYNSSSGMWVKNWGWDGSQSIPSWKAPDDWNLDPEPKYKPDF